MHPAAPTRRAHFAAALLALLTLAGCESTTGTNTNATVRFAIPAIAGSSVASAAGLTITGTNGTLLITDIKLVVDELELERVDVSGCDDDIEPDPEGCEEFESNLFVADVPLGTGSVTVANDRIPPGSYDELEFEVKDLFVDTDDPDDVARAARIAEVLALLRTTHADWPEGASVMIVGTFTPTGGTAVPFRVYAAGEVEVELTFLFPLVIDETSSGITIDLRPDLWFKNFDGSVFNLSLFDFVTTGLLLEFEAEFEGGVRVEID